ncbi:hypothetical protein [Pedobacter sp. Bi36]|uniref:hypothetical protein n=1 Tax=Pedobacter sp. Bi36 TaxID=2822352 RepID=UPI001D1E8750|nr:hypothetical protein [Pedobacter sp. Bi36]CAH0264862.1 hypothetical protein SRABI36_03569 [Pedobacter sp. Bi36]CAH0291346.1 hypothetical protein SRABI126_04063 [Pedobacter sp. Bi126]
MVKVKENRCIDESVGKIILKNPWLGGNMASADLESRQRFLKRLLECLNEETGFSKKK